jgi:hypothetical protein
MWPQLECPACPACPVAPADGTRVASENGTRVAPENGTRVASENGTRVAPADGTGVASENGTRVAQVNGTGVQTKQTNGEICRKQSKVLKTAKLKGVPNSPQNCKTKGRPQLSYMCRYKRK